MQHGEGLAPDGLPLQRRELAATLLPRFRSAGTRTMLVGETGIGKTYLIEALLETAAPRGGVLRVQLRPGSAREPYSAAREVVRNAEDTARTSTLDRRRIGPESPVPELVGALDVALRRLVQTGGVLVIDDWQWLDPESRSLLEQVLREPSARGTVTVLAARRPDGSDDDLAVHPLFGPSDLFVVEALSPRATADLVRSAARSFVSEAAAAEVGRASRGNPLLALELVASTDGRDHGLSTSGTFRAAMRDRLHGLHPDVRLLLATLAVTGPVRPSEMAMVCRRAHDAVDEACALDLVRRVGDELVLTEPFLGRVAAEQLTDDDVRRIHLLLADAPLPEHVRLEHRDDATASGPDEPLVQHLLDEADRLMRADDPERALRLVRRSLARMDLRSARFSERTVCAAELAATVADSALVLHLLGAVEVERLVLPLFDRAVPVLAHALERRAGKAALRRRLVRLRELVEGPVAKEIIALQLATGAWEGTASRQRDEVERITDALSADSAPRSWRVAQYWLATIALDRGAGLLEDRLSALRSAETPLMKLEDSVAVHSASWAYQSDDLSRSRTGLTALVRAAGLRGEPFVAVQSLAHLAKVELLAGRTDLAMRHLQQAEAGAASLTDLPPSLLVAKGLAAVRADDGTTLQILVDDPHGLRELGRGAMLSHGLLGLHAASSEDWDSALRELLHARQDAERQGIREPGRRLWLDIELARAFVATDDLDAADGVAAHLESIAGPAPRAHARGQALRVRGLLASARRHHEHASDLFQRALVDLERGGLRPELVRGRAELAMTLLALSELSEAVQQLDVARQEAIRIADPRLDLSLQSAAQRIEESAPTSSLTEAEQRVALLAADGDTNRSIAAKLFLSTRTVETHLANAYRKLGVRTRTQMRVALRRTLSV